MLDPTLIEKALALTGKTIDSMVHDNALAVFQEYSSKEWNPMDYFSIAEFCYYLLSPEFIEKYCEVNEDISYWTDREELATELFGRAIHEYQKGDEEPLISLLSKI